MSLSQQSHLLRSLSLFLSLFQPTWKKNEKIVSLKKAGGFAHTLTWDGSWTLQASEKVIGAWECLTSRKQSERRLSAGNWTGYVESNPFLLERKERRK